MADALSLGMDRDPLEVSNPFQQKERLIGAMSSLKPRELAVAMLDQARALRSQLQVLERDCSFGGEAASLARVLYRHVPELAGRLGAETHGREGWRALDRQQRPADTVLRTAAIDLKSASNYLEWAKPALSPEGRAMFDPAHLGNSIDILMDAVAKKAGIERTDDLYRSRIVADRPVEKTPARTGVFAAMVQSIGR